MPHLAGILDLRAEPGDIGHTLEGLARVLRVEGVAYQERSWHDDRFGAVNLLNESSGELHQPAVSEDGNRVLFLDGEIYNLDELRRDLVGPSHEHASGSAAGTCLALFERCGDAFAKRLNGQFNVVLYDKRARRVTIFNDRLAYRPLYYSHENGILLFALEKKAIFAARRRSPEFDPMGVLEFFAFGHNLEDRTVFQGIYAIPQGAVLHIDSNGVRTRQYWRPAYSRSGPTQLTESAEELGQRLCRATAVRADGPRRCGIFLSGGLDSRAVAGALATVRTDVTAFTFGGEDSAEVRYAREIADRLGFQHRRLSYQGVSHNEALPRIVWRTECAIPFNQTLSTEQHRYIHPDVQVMFNGHFGDALTGGHILPQQFLARGPDSLAAHILAKRTLMQLPGLRQVFDRRFLDEAYPEMFDAVRRTLRSFEETRKPLLYNLWDMTVRQRRFTFSSPAVDRYLFEQITPFVDNEVVDWALRLPLRFLAGQRAYKRMIVQTFPTIADVPWTRTGRPIPTSWVRDMARQSALFGARRVRRILRARQPKRQNRPGSWNLAEPGLRDRVERYMDSDAFLPEIFDRQSLRDMVERHFDRGEDFTAPMAALLTLAEGVRLFIEQTPDSPPADVRPQLTDHE